MIRLITTVLHGYGQMLLCLNPLTGLILVAMICYLSFTVGLLTLIAVISATLTAYVIRARPLHIAAGVYGFNGVVLGIAWMWFLCLSPLALVLLIVAAALSSVLMKLLINASNRTKANVPILSVPSVLVVWGLVLFLRTFFDSSDLIGPDQRMLDYLEIYEKTWRWYGTQFDLGGFIRTFFNYIVALFVIFVAVRVHSRISAMLAFASILVTVVTLFCLGGFTEFKSLEFYLYNTIPCGIALGGEFLVVNRRVLLYTFFGIVCIIMLTFFGLRYFPIPVFVAPFNLITIGFIWFVKSGRLNRTHGFYAVPMELISSPELGVKWYKGELYAEDYWQKYETALQEMR